MGTMSASDPAPLPRLGEVFFDVRGSARSMRLSWYAETGVAVFSIWQAGTCTGTFRLPMGELDRMIETLGRGPVGRLAADPVGRLAADDALTAFSRPHDPGRWDPEEAAARPGGQCGAGRLFARNRPVSGRPGPVSRRYRPLSRRYRPLSRRYRPLSRRTGPYPASIGPPDYVAERTQAHYAPELAGSGYGPESAHAAAITGAHNGGAVPGRGRRSKPPDSFPYGAAAGP